MEAENKNAVIGMFFEVIILLLARLVLNLVFHGFFIKPDSLYLDICNDMVNLKNRK